MGRRERRPATFTSSCGAALRPPNFRVVAVGDLFASSPDPDFAAGGSFVGWSRAPDEILKLDFDTIACTKPERP